ncbi:MAG: apolipoprotein N-acyltransferase, partial [Rhodobacteraceae bacterium]|nr:apolipoprotein N-acyltransferase [Paracoccaceae bacterium]
AALLVIAGFSFGLWRIMGPDPAAQGALVRLIQPNAAQSMKWDETRADEFFSRLTGLSAAPGAPDLVIWPETAVPYLLDYEPWVAPAIGASGQGAPVIAGIQRLDGSRYFNSLALIRPDGTLGVGYDKHHLVPFGEYIPFGDLAYDWFGLTAFASKAGQVYSAGPGVQVLDLGQGRRHGLGHVLPLICYEAVFPQDLRGTSRPDWLLQITNDAWFGTQSGPFQHAAQARLRAIETGLPLVRVANTGVTAVYDAKGRVMDSLPFGVAGKLDVTLPGAIGATPYARWGEWPVLILLLLFLLVGALPVWRRT